VAFFRRSVPPWESLVVVPVATPRRAPGLAQSARRGLASGQLYIPGSVCAAPVARVLAGTARRILRRLERSGVQMDEDPIAAGDPLMAMLGAASIRSRIATGPEAGVKLQIGGSRPVSKTSPVKKFADENRLAILISQKGASGPSPTNSESFVSRFGEFDKHIRGAQPDDRTAIRYSIRRYDMLPNWPTNLELPAAWKNGVALAQEEAALDELIEVSSSMWRSGDRSSAVHPARLPVRGWRDRTNANLETPLLWPGRRTLALRDF